MGKDYGFYLSYFFPLLTNRLFKHLYLFLSMSISSIFILGKYMYVFVYVSI